MAFAMSETRMLLTNILKQAEIFYELTPAELALIAAICREARYKAYDVIFEENAASRELYIIIQGEVDILVASTLMGQENRGANSVTIATLQRGQSFGEIALVDLGLRSATARCATNTHLLVIPRTELIGLCDAYPQLGYHLMRNLAADLALKIRGTDLRIREELLYGQRR
jgi:CRP-like cAMP-binding protein